MIISRPLMLITAAKFSVLNTSTAFLHRSKNNISRKGLNSLRHHYLSSSSLRMASSSSSSSPSPFLPDKKDSSTLRVALCQFHVTDNKNTNEDTARRYLSQAKEKGARMAVLPEIWNSPYATSAFPEYAERLPDIGDGLSSGEGGEGDGDSPKSKSLLPSTPPLPVVGRRFPKGGV